MPHFCLPVYPVLARLAGQLLSMHATKCSSERNWSVCGHIYSKARNRTAIEKAANIIYVRMNSVFGQAIVEDEEMHLTKMLKDSD